MFKAPLSYKYDKFDTTLEQNYKIRQGDLLRINLYSNGGYQLIDVINSGSGAQSNATQLTYLVKNNGYVKIPMIDSMSVEGKTVDEAEKMLEQLYSYYFIKPFVQLSVTNMRVVVFNGSGAGEIVTLETNSSTLAEVLARSGGLPAESKAYDIKVMRADSTGKLRIEKVDLSKIENVQKTQMKIFPNDIIYVTPGAQANTAIGQITPLMSFVLTTITFIVVITNGKF